MKRIVFEDIAHRPDVIRLKRRFGMFYGMAAGLSFAAATWGVDGYLLAQANVLYPWLKFIIGASLGMIAGGLAGWLVARSEKALLGLLLYLGLGLVLSWLIVALPFQVFPRVISWLDPETGSL